MQEDDGLVAGAAEMMAVREDKRKNMMALIVMD
jgi:hypothetical protein